MKFGNFELLIYMIWLVPVLAVFYLWSGKKEKTVMETFAERKLLPGIAPTYGRDPKRMRVFLNIAAVLFIILALARPQWGFYWKEDRRKGLDIMIAVDVSKSMLATDMQPDRLSYSKEELEEFAKRLRGDRVGLIAFAGDAFLQCPLTADYRGFLIALNDLNTDTIPKGGTSLSAAIEEAVRSYEDVQTKNKTMIVITDGENTEGDLHKAVAKAKKAGITISCIGIGSPEGVMIPVVDEKGKKTYLKDKSGKVVKSRLMETTLKAVAQETGGIYVRASRADFGLREIYQKRLSKLEKEKTADKKVKTYKERFQYPLAFALLLLVCELFLQSAGKHD